MTQLDFIQRVVVETFAELGDIAPAAVVTTIVIRNQKFIGYRFQCGGMEALWQANGNVVVFFDEYGNLVKAIRAGSRQSAA
jgi:hypothetical protein